MDDSIDSNIIEIIDEKNLGKDFFRIDRNKLLTLMLNYDIDIPINLNNIIFLCNHFFVKSLDLKNIAPRLILQKFMDAEEKYKEKKFLSS